MQFQILYAFLPTFWSLYGVKQLHVHGFKIFELQVSNMGLYKAIVTTRFFKSPSMAALYFWYMFMVMISLALLP